MDIHQACDYNRGMLFGGRGDEHQQSPNAMVQIPPQPIRAPADPFVRTKDGDGKYWVAFDTGSFQFPMMGPFDHWATCDAYRGDFNRAVQTWLRRREEQERNAVSK